MYTQALNTSEAENPSGEDAARAVMEMARLRSSVS